ncbi:MAG: hypothetical protein LBI28_07370 [Treponema sp.]|nr:hypothetical protein [Treponema sp.]
MEKVKVYLDNCVYNRPFDDQTQIMISLETEAKRHIQKLIIEKKIDLVCSFINRFENSKDKRPLSRNSINSFFVNATLYIDYSGATTVGKRASEIMKAGIKMKDAYHIACAIEGCCKYFITTDKPLLKYKRDEIIICSPIQFLDYYGEEKNG